MWPGSNPPVGPPPTGRGPAGTLRTPARSLRPGARWYAVPILLVLVAVTGFLTVFAYLRDDSRVAEGPSANGDPVAGVRIRLSGGYGYFIYVRTGQSSPFACSVEVGELTGPIRLTRKNSWSAAERASYRYTATFEAPVSGQATLRCRGTEGPILVTPDDTVRGYLRLAFLAAVGLGILAAVSFAVTLVRRGGARRGAVSGGG
ncbi:hypothetical protein E1281_15790 [Actinomadura sp. KC345]|uniref:hypothetical protein n=1 Tax=Actinomadura sp. KC345 TaxID=2530371 RepID=UPI00104A4970|nr:hypothetical protein [Actinomadura sp. KC345]TDC54691.1 hypothetical protein E1281_15790 [Actinomadura sp. KC345]